MNEKEFSDILLKAFNDNGLHNHINYISAKKLYQFSKILVETNKTFNLTSITEEKEIILKHFVDCARVLEHIPSNTSLIDVGCGAGFPSLPIAILRDDVKVTSLDSTAKKIGFINSVAKELSLENIVGVAMRAEEFAKANREKYDVSISRAVARLNILDELCIPLTKNGGLFIAMKSNKGEEEYNEASNGIYKLGASLEKQEKTNLSLDDQTIEREIYVFKKIKQTPPQYPRNYSQIIKKPL